MHSETCEVAVIGAGPYGLSTAAHLTSAGVTTRVFGDAMSFWRERMPVGMKLRSPWRASQIQDAERELSLDAFAAAHGVQRTENLPVDDFVRYGKWFQEKALPDLDGRAVSAVAPGPKGFALTLAGGTVVHANRVVVATGLTNQEFRPAVFDGLPRDLVSHSCEAVNPQDFRGQRVAVVGRGQSACETAVLLHEAGAEVELIARGDVHWIGSENPDAEQPADLKWRLREALDSPSAVGPFPLNWLVEVPTFLHYWPAAMRRRLSVRSLRPAATAWLRPRAAGMMINPGRTIVEAKAEGGGITLRLDNGTASTFDHTVLATGYKTDVSKLGILSQTLLKGIRLADGFPVLAAGLESTVPGLHFVGAPAVGSFGPLLRFVAGAGYAARSVTRAIRADRAPDPQSTRSGSRPAMMPSLQ